MRCRNQMTTSPGRGAVVALAGIRRRSATCLLMTLICTAVACAHREALPVFPPLPEPADAAAVSYREQVQPVLEHRCVVCHGCYDAPGKLLRSSPQGSGLGARKVVG